ncbi:flagellar hook protein FlgE [Catenovulum agarivorans DS-2]|uniref:Flagellar hook protein FlgE n=1 Tax=Catenovulum agarivorans DS-2 TaxID=1328313 RepID=W7QPY4_9ALTE|nr:flagellar hook protein FlgE [Catenovulum agarivorans]EWH09948.1 flagellar hook protein FlgE [Catenovulum agarivorans DS-2]
MSFNVALSGISVSQKDLNTTANNIANANTTGFKESRAEFGDVFATSVFGAGKTKVGDGGLTSVVAQQFGQGSLKFTNNSLDLAITGNGFFAMTPDLASRDMSFTRAGNFKLNEDNFVVSNKGHYLQVYPVNEDGTSQGVSLSTTETLRIPDSAGVPVATTNVEMTFNVDSTSTPLDPALFNPNDNTTYHASSSVTIFDSLGESHIQTTYYVKDENAASNTPPINRWYVFMSVDTDANGNPVPVDLNGTAIGASDANATAASGGQITASPTGYAAGDGDFVGIPLVFNNQGEIQSVNGYLPGTDAEPFVTSQPLGPTLTNTPPEAGVLTNGADAAQTITLDFTEPTQFASSFEVTSLEQDGATVGRLTGVSIADDGLVSANYSNGTVDYLGRVALVRFANDQGLQQIGNVSWKETISSGQPLAGEANTGTFGTIVSSALEQSNVDITQELVDLITSQKSFQANSRALDVNSQLQQNILQIR